MLNAARAITRIQDADDVAGAGTPSVGQLVAVTAVAPSVAYGYANAPATSTLDAVVAAGGTTARNVSVGALAATGSAFAGNVVVDNGVGETTITIGSATRKGTIYIGDVGVISKGLGSTANIGFGGTVIVTGNWTYSNLLHNSGGAFYSYGGGPTYLINDQSSRPVVIGDQAAWFGSLRVVEITRDAYFHGKAIFAAVSSTANRSVHTVTATLPVTTDATRTGRVDYGVLDYNATRTALSLGADGTNALFGVLGTAPVPRQTVTGSRSSNAALASLITALAAFGLVIDSTT